MMDTLHFFNPYAEVRHTENLLPHWQQEGAVCFVTFRLADSIPAHLLEEWGSERAAWLQFHPEPWNAKIEREYHNRFSGAIEHWLDAGYGSCVLWQIKCAKIVAGALRQFDAARFALISSVVNPNHVHALFMQKPEHPLEDLIRSWEDFHCRSINQLLGRRGSLWQRSYFDRLVRDEQHFANCVRYIRRNPEKARLNVGEYILHETDVAKQID
jgi:putative transposase